LYDRYDKNTELRTTMDSILNSILGGMRYVLSEMSHGAGPTGRLAWLARIFEWPHDSYAPISYSIVLVLFFIFGTGTDNSFPRDLGTLWYAVEGSVILVFIACKYRLQQAPIA
jgi:hypothetical protein